MNGSHQPESRGTDISRWCMQAAVAAVLAGCAGTPPPPAAIEPPPDLPSAWTATGEGRSAEGTLNSDWWTAFGDVELDACVATALKQNRDLAAAAARVFAANELAILAGAPVLPTVDAQLDAQRSRRVFVGFPFGTGGVPSNTATILNANLTVRWELDLWNRLRSTEAAALADAQASTADFAAARTSLAGQVCRAYFALVEAREQLRLTEATVTAFAATADDVRERFRRGVRPAIDTYQSTTSLESARADRALRQQRLAAAARQLEVLMGRYPGKLVNGAETLTRTLPEVPAGLPSVLLDRRPDLAAAERRLAASGCRVDAARAALYPRLSLTASGGTNSEELSDLLDDSFRVWSLGANLLQPLFRGGALRAEVRRNEAVQLTSIAEYGAALLRAFAEVENALESSTWLAQQERAVQSAAENSAMARDLARERYQLGLTTFLEVQDSQQRAFVAQSANLAVRRQRIDNRIDLILALGGGYGNAAVTAPDSTAEQSKP
jgi:NodT family efflux transporter outer membrane factor (OMF) lipoprotein